MEISTKPKLSRKAKLITSAVIWYCTFTLGLGVSFIGASLLELSKKFDTTIPTISKVFSVLTCSFLVGAIACGVLFNYVNRQLTSALLLFLMSICSILMPLVPSLPLFFLMAGLTGFTAAGYDTAQIVWIIEMWENEAGVYIQTQHFSFAVGTLISPLLVKPFLSVDPLPMEIKIQSNYTTIMPERLLLGEQGTTGEGGNNTLDTLIYNYPIEGELEDSKLYVPFLIGGLASIFGAFLLTLIYFTMKYEKPAKKPKEEEEDTTGKDDSFEAEESSAAGKSKSCNSRRVVLVLLSAMVLGAYQGMEMCSMQFLPTFTHFIDLKLSKQDGALILSGLTGAFTVGRGIGILIVLKVLPEILLLVHIMIILIGNTLLLSFANTSYVILLIGSIMLGIGFSTVFPSFYGFIEKHLKVSNVVGGLMIVAGGLVSSAYPIIIGSYVETNPFVLMYTNYVSLSICTTAFIVIYAITRKKSVKSRVDVYTVNDDISSKSKGITSDTETDHEGGHGGGGRRVNGTTELTVPLNSKLTKEEQHY